MNSTDLTPLGALFEAVRQAKRPKLSQNAVAKAAATSSTTYRRIISGVSRFGSQDVPFAGSADTVAQIARALGVTPEQLEEVDRADAAEELRHLVAGDPTPREQRITIGQAKADRDNAARYAQDAAAEDDDPKMQRAMELLAEATAMLEDIRRERREGA